MFKQLKMSDLPLEHVTRFFESIDSNSAFGLYRYHSCLGRDEKTQHFNAGATSRMNYLADARSPQAVFKLYSAPNRCSLYPGSVLYQLHRKTFDIAKLITRACAWMTQQHGLNHNILEFNDFFTLVPDLNVGG